MNDQAENLRKMKEGFSASSRSPILKPMQTKARVITVTSGKGGVGKTNLTVNMALAFAKEGKKVLLIDADLGLSNVDVVLGCTPPYNLFQLLQSGYALSDVIADGPLGIKFVSGGSGIYDLTNLSDSQLHYFIDQIGQFDHWADIILIDTGAGLNRNVLNFVMAADEVIIITTPEPPAVTDAYAMMKTYSSQHGKSLVRLIVNRVHKPEEGEAVTNKLTKVAFRFLGLSVSSLGLIYEDRLMQKAVNSQVPLLISYPESISARCIERISHALLFGEDIPVPRGFKGFIQRLIASAR